MPYCSVNERMGQHRLDTENRRSDGQQPLGPSGDPRESAGVTTPHPTGATKLARLLNIRKSDLLTYFGGSLFSAAAVATASPYLSPIALGAALMGVFLLVGWLTISRRRNGTENHNGPVSALRRELDVSRRQYERLFSAVPCFICVLDPEHHILEANELYRREFGATERSHCYEVCKRRTSECPDCIVDATYADGVSRSNEETLVTRDGRQINAVVHTQPIYEKDGTISAVMEVFTDVTEVKKLQRQLALTGRAVAGTAHRVKNILMGLEGGIFIVNDGLEEDNREAIAEGWEMVERNVGRVSSIVKDLLYCSKERAPEFEANVCPQEIALEVRDLFANRTADEHIEVLAEVSEPRHLVVLDPEAIHNLLCNLVANAIDACRFDSTAKNDGHRVIIRCNQNGNGDTVFEVKDNGEGIPEEMSRKVFQEFFSSKGTEGTGIGLLVVQKVAEEHGGTVSFTSEPGKGTTFWVTIPRIHQLHPAHDPKGDQPLLNVLSQ